MEASNRTTSKAPLLLLGIICAATLAFVLVKSPNGEGQCPVPLPPYYRPVEFQPEDTSAQLALTLQGTAKDVGTADGWIFDAPGSAASAAPLLLAHLQTIGPWYLKKSRNEMFVFVHAKDKRLVSMFPKIDRSGKRMLTMHRVRVNGEYHQPGLWESALSHLPNRALEAMTKP